MKVITTIARQHESAKIFRLVRSIDPDAFVSQSKVRGVFGQGFNSINEMAQEATFMRNGESPAFFCFKKLAYIEKK